MNKVYLKKGIVIEDDVWIGAGVKILDGVIIRKGCVIGANTVVNKSTEQYGIYVGSTCSFNKKKGIMNDNKKNDT